MWTRSKQTWSRIYVYIYSPICGPDLIIHGQGYMYIYIVQYMEQFLTYMVKDICIYSPIYGPDLNKHGPRYMHIYIVQYMEQF